MSIVTRNAVASLRRIGISQRVSITCDGLFYGELQQSDDGRSWDGRVWLANDPDIGSRHGQVIWQWRAVESGLGRIVEAAEVALRRHIEADVTIDRRILATGYFSPQSFEGYPHLKADHYEACAVYDSARRTVFSLIDGDSCVWFVGDEACWRMRYGSTYESWFDSRSSDRGYLAWLVSEDLKRRGFTPQIIPSLVR
jgi:hypothetical protein